MENYRLILVDDEFIVRDGISRCVPWGENGFELCGLFENGLEARDYIANNPVDIVITDINMPRMDGLALSRYLTESYPHIMVLLLTGYDEFEYAREAVKTQVREFLMKPITAEELALILARLRGELDAEREKTARQEAMREKLKESFPLLRERFLHRLVSGKLDDSVERDRQEFFQWEDLMGWYKTAVITVPDSWSDMDRLMLSEFLKAEKGRCDEIFHDREEQFILLFQDRDRTTLESRLAHVVELAFLKAVDLQTGNVSAGLGESVREKVKLPLSFKGAVNAAEYSHLAGVSQILSIEEVRSREGASADTVKTMASEITGFLREGRMAEARESLEALFFYLEEHYVTSEETVFFFTRLHVQLIDFIADLNLNTTHFTSIENALHTFSSLDAALDFFRLILESIEKRIADRRHDLVNSRIDKARDIIASRYRDRDFSLQDICSELCLSSSQFSVLFKEGTGQTFVEYLTAFRMEKAKTLLTTTDRKSYEIAEESGYADPRYFSILFKKHTGMTPMEYRKNRSL